VQALLFEHYFDRDVAAQIAAVLEAGLNAGRYPDDLPALAAAVTASLQSVNGDQHLRLVLHADELPERDDGDDAEEYAAMAEWAARTSSGVAKVERFEGNIGYVELAPVLFPVVITGEVVSAALTIVADTEALIVDVRQCLGGDPEQVAWVASYLFGHDPVELSALAEPRRGRLKQSWTHAYVPGRRFGPDKPVFVLTSGTTFSGGEQLSYDMQRLGRATVVGEGTRGGAHAREGFRVHPHLEATIPVARAVNPVSGGNWEGVGVIPDVACSAETALEHALVLAAAARPSSGSPVN
jgi:C-terminal processing protease CtpA/Prc